jgi:hypothetical protein
MPDEKSASIPLKANRFRPIGIGESEIAIWIYNQIEGN